ncbi:MAG: thioredoxin fold domain-containing protein [Amphritea sp.]|nr:thioredoxin fold domain-containing protein [Amphritea sp.]
MLRYLSLTLLLCVGVLSLPANATTKLQALEKGQEIPEPEWFKDSFLDLSDDLEEAAEEDKKLVLYYHQAGCPYCYNLITQVFGDPEVSAYMQEHYQLIAFNLWGDRLVTLPDGTEMTEKELAVALKIQYTPTLIFLDAEGTPELRLDGYRHKQQFMKQLAILNGTEKVAIPVATESMGILTVAIEWSNKPVAIQFVTDECEACLLFEGDILERSDSQDLLNGFQQYRINLSVNPLIQLPDGQTVQAREWAKQLGISYYPAWLLLDKQGQEQFRIDAYVRAFHFNTALDYVLGEHYRTQPEFQRYINERADAIREQGRHVDILQ